MKRQCKSSVKLLLNFMMVVKLKRVHLIGDYGLFNLLVKIGFGGKITYRLYFWCVALQAKTCNFTKIKTPPWVFFTFLKLYKWYQIAQRITFFHWEEKHCVIFLYEEKHFTELWIGVSYFVVDVIVGWCSAKVGVLQKAILKHLVKTFEK